MSQSSKELVRILFDFNDLKQVPFIPWVCGFAANVEQIQIPDMLSDAGLLSKALINTQKLFRYDAIAPVFDASLEAEACGCGLDWGDGSSMPRVTSHPLSEGATINDLDIANLDKRGRIRVTLEAAKRIKAIAGKETAIVGVITGPLSLARSLTGEAFDELLNRGDEDQVKLVSVLGAALLKLGHSYCEIGVDVIAVNEEIGTINPDGIKTISGPLRSIWNVSRFYNVHTLFLGNSCTPQHIEPILELAADGISLSGNLDYACLRETTLKRRVCCASLVPNSVLSVKQLQSAEYNIEGLLAARENGVFVSSDGEIPATTDVNTMHELVRLIRDSSS